MTVQFSEKASPMSPIERRTRLPLIAASFALGAKAFTIGEDKESVHVKFCDETQVMNIKDFEDAKRMADVIRHRVDVSGSILTSPETLLKMVDMAGRLLGDESTGHKVLMLTDSSSVGWWRMRTPAKFLPSDWHIDITGTGVLYEKLLGYDTIFTQLLHSWEHVYMIEHLKKAGKRIVYDIDDNLFAIPKNNPAHSLIRIDEKQAAVACMKSADVVTTTTPEMQDLLRQVLENQEVIVVPNSIDTDDRWQATPFLGSRDEWKRILWQGTPTHDDDWLECGEAVERIMDEMSNVRLVILGALPTFIQERVSKWPNRIEFLGFQAPETYYELSHHIAAEVALAPLQDNQFNRCKSPIKWLEATMVGIPVVASDIPPYQTVASLNMTDRVMLLASSPSDWYTYIKTLLEDRKKGRQMVMEARRLAAQEFDIKKNVKVWEQILRKPTC